VEIYGVPLRISVAAYEEKKVQAGDFVATGALMSSQAHFRARAYPAWLTQQNCDETLKRQRSKQGQPQ